MKNSIQWVDRTIMPPPYTPPAPVDLAGLQDRNQSLTLEAGEHKKRIAELEKDAYERDKQQHM
jgi:hypothetical protein